MQQWNYFNGKDEVFSTPDGKPIFEAASANEDDQVPAGSLDDGSLQEFAAKQMRAEAMSLALAWVEDGDFSFEALDGYVVGISDMDGSEDLDAEEEAHYNDLLTAVGEAFVWLGAKAENVQSFLESEDAEEGAALGNFLSTQLDGKEDDDDTLIGKFVVQVASGMIMESVIKVVRGGSIVLKKKRVGRPHKMSALQKASLKKARMRSHTGVAKLARRKSMKIRKKRGL